MKKFEIHFNKFDSWINGILRGKVKVYEGRSCTDMKVTGTCQIEIFDGGSRLFPSEGNRFIVRLSDQDHDVVTSMARHYLAGICREESIYRWTGLEGESDNDKK